MRCSRHVSLLALALLAATVSSRTASASETALTEAIRYFERMSIKPNTFKREDDNIVMNFARAAILGARDSKLIALLRRSLEPLARDPECAKCQIPLIAAATGDSELIYRAAVIVRESIGNSADNSTPQTRSSNFRAAIDNWVGIMWQFSDPLKRPTVIQAAARLLVAAGVRPQTFARELADLVVPPPPGGPHAEIARAFLELSQGRDFLEHFTADARNQRLHEAINRLKKPDEYPERYQDIQTIRPYSQNPEVIALIPRLIEQAPWGSSDINKSTLILLALASGNETAHTQALRSARDFLDTTANRDANREWDFDHYMNQDRMDEEERGFHRRFVEHESTTQKPSRPLVLYSLFEMALSRLQGIQALPPALNAAKAIGEFFSQLQFDRAALRDFMEIRYYVRTNDGQSKRELERQLAESYLIQIHGPDAPRQALIRLNERELELALANLAQQGTEQNRVYFDTQSITRIFLENSFRPEVTAALRDRVVPLWKDCGSRWNNSLLMMTALTIGDETLKAKVKDAIVQSTTQPGPADCGFRPMSLLDLVANSKCSLSSAVFQPLADATIELLANLNLDLDSFWKELENNNRLPYINQQPPNTCYRQHEGLLPQFIAKLRGEEFLAALTATQRAKNEDQELSHWRSQFKNVLDEITNMLAGPHAPQVEDPERVINWLPTLFRRASDPTTLAFLKQAMGNPVLTANPLLDRLLTLTALAAQDPELTAIVRMRLETRIRGQDMDFEDATGLEFHSPSERLAYLVRELTAQPETLFAIPTLLASLQLETSIIRQGLAQVIKEKRSSAAARTAAETLALLAQHETSPSTSPNTNIPLPHEAKRVFVYINGGYSPTSDFPQNEEALRAFNISLFGEEGVLFSGGGENGLGLKYTPNAVGGGDLDPLIPSTKQHTENWHIETASAAKIEPFFSNLGRTPPDDLVVVYGGHGNRYGLALWDGEMVSADKVAGFYHALPASTTIRSVFMQCFAGATVVPPVRLLPRTIIKVHQFFNTYYPTNRCALATASEDELGTYLVHSYPGKNGNYWQGFFESEPNGSLHTLKRRIQDNSAVNTLPVATTDYFVHDLVAIVCNQPDAFAKFLDFDLRAACKVLSDDPLHRQEQELHDFFHNVDSPYDSALDSFTSDLIHRYFPDILVDTVAEAERVDKASLIAKYLAQGKDREIGLSAQDLDKLVRILSSGNLYDVTAQTALSRSPVIRSEFDAWFKAFMAEPKHLSMYSTFNPPDSQDPSSFHAEQLAQNLTLRTFGLQQMRKQLAKPYRIKERKLAEALLKHVPAFAEEANRYRAVYACEKRPLRSR